MPYARATLAQVAIEVSPSIEYYLVKRRPEDRDDETMTTWRYVYQDLLAPLGYQPRADFLAILL